MSVEERTSAEWADGDLLKRRGRAAPICLEGPCTGQVLTGGMTLGLEK